MLVENRDVGGKSGLEAAAIPDSEEVGRLRGDALDRLLEGHRSAFAHPGAEEIRAVACVAEHVHMRAAVGETDHGARIGDQLSNSGFMMLLHRELNVQVGGECEVEKSSSGSLCCSSAIAATVLPSFILSAGLVTSRTSTRFHPPWNRCGRLSSIRKAPRNARSR